MLVPGKLYSHHSHVGMWRCARDPSCHFILPVCGVPCGSLHYIPANCGFASPARWWASRGQVLGSFTAHSRSLINIGGMNEGIASNHAE